MADNCDNIFLHISVYRAFVRSIEVNRCWQINIHGMSLHLLFVVLKLRGHGVDSSASPHLVAKVVAVVRFIENNCTPPNKHKLGLCWI